MIIAIVYVGIGLLVGIVTCCIPKEDVGIRDFDLIEKGLYYMSIIGNHIVMWPFAILMSILTSIYEVLKCTYFNHKES